MAKKAREAFRTISEVADWLDIPAHVLRFWESKFSQIKPVKRAGGRRYYRPADMKLIGGIKKLLHDDGLTIRGVQKMIKEEGVKHISSLSPPLNMPTDEEAAKRRTARRARRQERSAKSRAKTSTASGDLETKSARPDVEDAELVEETASETDQDAPFIDVTSEDAKGGDNIVSLTPRDTDQADQSTSDDKDVPSADTPAEAAPKTEPSVAEPPTQKPEAADDAAVWDAPDEKPRVTADMPAVPDDPDPNEIDASEAQVASTAALKSLRRADLDELAATDKLLALHKRLRTLRDRVAEAVAKD